MPFRIADYSRRRLLQSTFVFLSIAWTMQMYGTVGNHPMLAWLYPLLTILCASKFAVVSSVYMCVLIASEVVPARLYLPEIGLALQTILAIMWTIDGTLLRRFEAGTRAARILDRSAVFLRPGLFLAATLFASTLLHRRTDAHVVLWAIMLLCAAWSILPLRWPGWKSATATFVLSILGLIPAVAILEIGCRVLFPMTTPKVSIASYHPEALWTLGPHASGTMTYGSSALGEPIELSSYSVLISSKGLRDREFGPKQSGEVRVLLLGDSFTFGWGLDIEQTVGRQLEAMLNTSGLGKQFTVINAGVDGYGPWQERIRLREIGFSFEPDLVVLQLYPANDINNSLNKIGKRMRAFDPVWEYLVEGRRYWSHWEVRSDDWLRKRSAVYNQLARAMDTPSPLMDALNDFRFYRRRTPPLPKSAERPFWLEVHLKEWYPELNEGLRIMESDVLAIRNECESRSIPFVLYTVPDVNSVCDYSWDWNMKEVENASIYERAKDLKVADEFCAREALNWVDLAGAMRASGDPCELYYEADGHLTPTGAKVTAQALSDYLVSKAAR